MQKITRLGKILQSLKPFQIWNYSLYTIRMRLGAYKKAPPQFSVTEIGRFTPLNFPVSDQVLSFLLADSNRIEETAQKILSGRFFPFMKNVSEVLNLEPQNPTRHWTKIHPSESEDIKLIWEPARFSWAYSLVRAWLVSKKTGLSGLLLGANSAFQRSESCLFGRELVFRTGIGYAHHHIILLCERFFEIISGGQ